MIQLLFSSLPIQVAGKIVSFLTASVMAKNLDTEVFGAVAFLFTSATLLSLLQSFGMPRYLVSLLPAMGGVSQDLFRSIFYRVMQSSIVVALILIILSEVSSVSIDFSVIVLCTLLSTILALFQTFNYAFRSAGRTVYMITIETLLQPAFLLLCFLVFLQGLNVSQFTVNDILLFYISSFLCSLLLISLRLADYPKKTNAVLNLKTQIPFFFIMLTGAVNVSVDTFMLGIMAGSEQVAFYRVAMQLYVLCSFFQVSVHAILMPRFAYANASNNFKAIQSDYIVMRILNVFYVSCTLAMLFFWGPELVSYFFGENYLPSINLFFILGISLALVACIGPIGILMQTNGQSSALARIMVCGAILNITLNLVLIGLYSAVGAAIATAVSNLITTSTCYFFNFKAQKI